MAEEDKLGFNFGTQEIPFGEDAAYADLNSIDPTYAFEGDEPILESALKVEGIKKPDMGKEIIEEAPALELANLREKEAEEMQRKAEAKASESKTSFDAAKEAADKLRADKNSDFAELLKAQSAEKRAEELHKAAVEVAEKAAGVTKATNDLAAAVDFVTNEGEDYEPAIVIAEQKLSAATKEVETATLRVAKLEAEKTLFDAQRAAAQESDKVSELQTKVESLSGDLAEKNKEIAGFAVEKNAARLTFTAANREVEAAEVACEAASKNLAAFDAVELNRLQGEQQRISEELAKASAAREGLEDTHLKERGGWLDYKTGENEVEKAAREAYETNERKVVDLTNQQTEVSRQVGVLTQDLQTRQTALSEADTRVETARLAQEAAEKAYKDADGKLLAAQEDAGKFEISLAQTKNELSEAKSSLADASCAIEGERQDLANAQTSLETNLEAREDEKAEKLVAEEAKMSGPAIGSAEVVPNTVANVYGAKSLSNDVATSDTKEAQAEVASKVDAGIGTEFDALFVKNDKGGLLDGKAGNDIVALQTIKLTFRNAGVSDDIVAQIKDDKFVPGRESRELEASYKSISAELKEGKLTQEKLTEFAKEVAEKTGGDVSGITANGTKTEAAVAPTQVTAIDASQNLNRAAAV